MCRVVDLSRRSKSAGMKCVVRNLQPLKIDIKKAMKRQMTRKRWSLVKKSIMMKTRCVIKWRELGKITTQRRVQAEKEQQEVVDPAQWKEHALKTWQTDKKKKAVTTIHT